MCTYILFYHCSYNIRLARYRMSFLLWNVGIASVWGHSSFLTDDTFSSYRAGIGAGEVFVLYDMNMAERKYPISRAWLYQGVYICIVCLIIGHGLTVTQTYSRSLKDWVHLDLGPAPRRRKRLYRETENLFISPVIVYVNKFTPVNIQLLCLEWEFWDIFRPIHVQDNWCEAVDRPISLLFESVAILACSLGVNTMFIVQTDDITWNQGCQFSVNVLWMFWGIIIHNAAM